MRWVSSSRGHKPWTAPHHTVVTIAGLPLSWIDATADAVAASGTVPCSRSAATTRCLWGLCQWAPLSCVVRTVRTCALVEHRAVCSSRKILEPYRYLGRAPDPRPL